MAKGKSTCVAWVCTETGFQSKVFWYNKRNEIKKEKKLFCKLLKKHTLHKIKPVKS